MDETKSFFFFVYLNWRPTCQCAGWCCVCMGVCVRVKMITVQSKNKLSSSAKKQKGQPCTFVHIQLYKSVRVYLVYTLCTICTCTNEDHSAHSVLPRPRKEPVHRPTEDLSLSLFSCCSCLHSQTSIQHSPAPTMSSNTTFHGSVSGAPFVTGTVTCRLLVSVFFSVVGFVNERGDRAGQ